MALPQILPVRLFINRIEVYDLKSISANTGKGLANPTALLLSSLMMLRFVVPAENDNVGQILNLHQAHEPFRTRRQDREGCIDGMNVFFPYSTVCSRIIRQLQRASLSREI